MTNTTVFVNMNPTTLRKYNTAIEYNDQARFNFFLDETGRRYTYWSRSDNLHECYIPNKSELSVLLSTLPSEPQLNYAQQRLRRCYTEEESLPNLEFVKLLLTSFQENFSINIDGDDTDVRIFSEINGDIVKDFIKDNKIPIVSEENYPSQHLLRQSHAETGPRARTAKYSNLIDKKIRLDKNATISMLEESEYELLVSQIPENLKCIEIKNKLFRGSDPLQIEVKNFSKEQILRKQVLVPYLSKVKIYNFDQKKFLDAYVFNFAFNLNLEKLTKYKKAQSLFGQLCELFDSEEPEAILDNEKWQSKFIDKNKIYFKYWDGLKKIVKDPSRIGFISLLDSPFYKSEINPQALFPSVINKKVKSSSEYASFTKISERYNSVVQEEKELVKKIAFSSREMSSLEMEKSGLEKRLKKIEHDFAKEEAVKTNLQKRLEGVESGSSSLKQAFKEASETIKTDIIDNISLLSVNDKLEESRDLINKLRKSGIKITRISYANENGDLVTDPREIELAFKQSLINKVAGERSSGSLALQAVSFITEKPVIIRVDAHTEGENCQKIVGGPYAVTVNPNALSIKLASLDACFGYAKQSNGTHKVWVHPHTGPMVIGSTNISRDCFAMRNACLGEGAPGIWAAFEENNPIYAVFAAMVWVTSANSADEWGRNWKKFPRLKDVDLDSTSTKSEEETSVEDNAEEEAEVQEIETEEIPITTISENHNDPEENQNLEDEEFLETEEYYDDQEYRNLRLAGNPNYRYYAG